MVQRTSHKNVFQGVNKNCKYFSNLANTTSSLIVAQSWYRLKYLCKLVRPLIPYIVDHRKRQRLLKMWKLWSLVFSAVTIMFSKIACTRSCIIKQYCKTKFVFGFKIPLAVSVHINISTYIRIKQQSAKFEKFLQLLLSS